MNIEGEIGGQYYRKGSTSEIKVVNVIGVVKVVSVVSRWAMWVV